MVLKGLAAMENPMCSCRAEPEATAPLPTKMEKMENAYAAFFTIQN